LWNKWLGRPDLGALIGPTLEVRLPWRSAMLTLAAKILAKTLAVMRGTRIELPWFMILKQTPFARQTDQSRRPIQAGENPKCRNAHPHRRTHEFDASLQTYCIQWSRLAWSANVATTNGR
jgi:hypothetical protein